jgi:aminopeptidase-like protein
VTPPDAGSAASLGQAMHGFVRELFPLCRSITGDGLRQTLRMVADRIPLQLHEVASGTPVLDWVVPPEWHIRGARIETLAGDPVVDFADCNLHVVSYSTPVDTVVSREELAAHVHTLPDQPELVPYRTGYYAERWGFCLSHRVWESMGDPQYRVRIDSTLAPGSLTYGELAITGREPAEVLVSVHCCHPSLANDNLSGVAVATELARHLLLSDNRLSYRFLFIPATIGSLTWLAQHEDVVPRIAHGLVLSCVGDAGPFHYKQSRRGDAPIDRIVAHELARRGQDHRILPFSPFGYDERQYCSPAYDLPVGCFMRSPNGTFPQYHTSADNPGFVTPAALEESLDVLVDVTRMLEHDRVFERVDGRGEPQLGRRGLYRAISGQKDHAETQMALLWVLNQSDGRHSLLDIAQRSGVGFDRLAAEAGLAEQAGLIRPVAAPPKKD